MRLLLMALGLLATVALPALAADAPSPSLVPKSPASAATGTAPATTGTAPAATGTAPAKAPLRPSLVEWRADFASALKEAAASGRIVMIFFTARWCEPCQLMDSGPFAVPIVAKFIAQNCVPVKADDTQEISALSKRFQVRAYPTLLFLSASGEPLHEVVGPLSPADLYHVIKDVRALQPLIDAQRKAPDDLEANSNLATAWVGLDQLRRAEPYLRRTAELDPKNEKGRGTSARLLLAIVPTEDGDIAKALKDLEAWMVEFKDSPEMPSALLFKGKILFNDGKLLEARAVFDDLRNRFISSGKAYDADKAIDDIDARLKAEEAAKKAAAEAAAKKKAAATATGATGGLPASVSPTAAPAPTSKPTQESPAPSPK